MIIPTPGSKWTATEVKFIVNRIEEDQQGTWVHYTRTHDLAEFSCLLGAFLQRFREDKSYGS